MDEFETDGHPEREASAPATGFQDDAEPAAFQDGAGSAAVQDDAGSAAFQDDAEPVDFVVDYEHSGDRRVDDALDRLARLPGTPLPGHADVYDAVHTELRAILSEQPAGSQGPR